MALGTGTRLGRYEIMEPIGTGGMGAVYHARDTSLGRDVAIKVLLDEFTADADRVRRFEREAKATAALNHPNLLAVYDVGTHEGLIYLVSELLQGRTLRDALAAGPMPPRRAARLAAQIADGLAAAHAKGIVHRDLKPANLFVAQDDRVKILDFGLARVVATSPIDDSATRSTETSLTTVGTVLGSAGYMAPEQVRGAPIDHRADIFSLGCVLYEMLAGRRAFHRESVAGTLAAIVESDPPTWSGDGSIASQRLMRITRRCLEKNPEQRFQSAQDLAHVLADESAEDSGGIATPSPRRQSWKTIAMVTTAIALAATAFGVWAWLHGGRLGDPPAAQSIYFEVDTPADMRRLGGPVVSNDGRQIAFVARGNNSNIYLRQINDANPRLLAGTEGARQPFFSPLGNRLAFFASGSLKVTMLDTGVTSILCPAPDARGGSWGDDDQIVFAAGSSEQLSRIHARGGTPEPITTLGPDDYSHRWPTVLPGASGIIYVALPKRGQGSAIMSLAKGSTIPVRLVDRATAPRYSAGFLFYVTQDEELHAAPFDAQTLIKEGPGVAQPEHIDLGFNQTDFAYNLSRDGTMAYVPFRAGERSLVIVGPGGKTEKIPGAPRPFEAPRISPSGDKIAVTIKPRTEWGDVWIGDVSGNFLPLTRDGVSRNAVWSAQSDEVAVESLRDGGISSIFVHPLDGKSVRGLEGAGEGHVYPASWPSTGIMMLGAYNIRNKPGIEELRSIALPQAASRFPINASQAYGRVSPDGKWLAYTIAESGQPEVYLTAFPTPGRMWPISKAGYGREPVWAKNSRDLFFLRADGQVMAVGIGPDGPGDLRSAGVGLFPLGPRGPGDPWWDTLPDGRFIVAQSISNQPPLPISVVVNRFAALSTK